MPLRIVIDARWIFPRLSGIGLYTRELIGRLARLDVEDDFILLFDHPVVADRVRREANLDACGRVHVRRIDYGVFSLASQLRLPRLLRELKADVYHAPNYLIPFRAFPHRRRRTACVVTLHDLIPYCHPEYTPRARKRWLGPLFRRMMREAARRANTVIVPSEATARDVRRHLLRGADAARRIRVIPEGVDPRFCPADPVPSETVPPEIVYVGRYDPYKNVPLLVEAFSHVLRRFPEARLRLVGEPDPRYPEAAARAKALGLGDRVICQGYVDNAALVEAYRRATVFALPSRCEGFGLTVVEAMACGTPVVCTTAGSLPEVVGDAALTVAPNSVEELADALIRVLSDPDLSARLRGAGLARARAFSWPAAARATLDAYRAAAEARS